MNNIEENINKLIEAYKNVAFGEESIPFQLELAYLKRIKKELEWGLLTDEQKQNERRDKLNGLLLKLYKNDRNQFIDYEESVVELYDEITKIIEVLINKSNKPFPLERLLTILLIEKQLINKYNKIFKITHIDRRIIDNIFKLLADYDIYEEFKPLELAFQKMFGLLPNETYRI